MIYYFNYFDSLYIHSENLTKVADIIDSNEILFCLKNLDFRHQ